MSNEYHGAYTCRARSGGGSVKVALSAGVGQGNGGTALSCAGCWVQSASANTEVVKMNIGAAASATLGVELAHADTNTLKIAQPLWVPVSDVSLLYFYSSDADAIVDITYLAG